MRRGTKEAADEKERIERYDRVVRAAQRRYQKLDKQRRGARGPLVTPDRMRTRRSIINPYDGLAIERIINQSDLFPISHLQLGFNAGKAVCRISVKGPGGRVLGYGTGFMVSPTLLLTNNHVLNTAETAQFSLAEFNYEDDEQFMPRQSVSYRLDPGRFFLTDEALDFTLVAVQESSNTVCPLSDFGCLKLLPFAGKILEGEYVSIIQHPQGGQKAVTVRENQVRFLSEDFIHYVTDTEPGSSGSPVFNDQWIVVALHHAGVPDPEDPSKWIANEGVRISSIFQRLAAGADELGPDARALLQELLGGTLPESPRDDFMQIGELGQEWYEKATGYDPVFLGEGFEVPLPVLSEELQPDIARTQEGQEVLHYTHFSIVMSQSRKLAFYTASNIDGELRQNLKRSGDKWYYDPRISQEFQCGPALYSKNELDRGHLVRRLDPVWGSDAASANEDTFHFTNCSPQHKNLNQKTWLNLEDYILNNAATHRLKVVVFTGPVFRSDDMVYRREYRIPAEFWKVAVIVREGQALSATAYLQTQKNLITDLEFAYGEYETYQVPITQIESLTGLDFGTLRDHDPIQGLEASAFRVEGPGSLHL
ncbi:DNA/RNA non-specific endonuclease [Proteiniclasticum sp. QWL-01]|uniref:DNA/RNA non-specific endonuclease n=1 Tax=Proteiniclasticum sp. QWL-01 TaxID=3036945 RepID=UPI0024116A71|nr:DNA/RNA non-specific endonuclease [Proteiniclasticum sp. QWL-01]WFF73420.1 DNA/RNA non-specific endonuclease [Proteiniclasticum sp. QWL-01]